MEFISKSFLELNTHELYEIIKSRTQIFLIEQNIICQDLDDVDYNSLHCFFYENKRVVAYLRAFLSEKDVVGVGRVLTLEHKKGIGTNLMNKSIEQIKKRFNCKKIFIHAQKQAMEFYRKLGFKVVSDEFLEEGVVHISMEMEV